MKQLDCRQLRNIGFSDGNLSVLTSQFVTFTKNYFGTFSNPPHMAVNIRLTFEWISPSRTRIKPILNKIQLKW